MRDNYYPDCDWLPGPVVTEVRIMPAAVLVLWFYVVRREEDATKAAARNFLLLTMRIAHLIQVKNESQQGFHPTIPD